MDMATIIPTRQLRKIQRVRMELGVLHISNICSADGRRLDKRFLSNKMKSIVRSGNLGPVKHNVTKQDNIM